MIKILLLLVGLAILGNLVVLDLLYWNKKPEVPAQVETKTIERIVREVPAATPEAAPVLPIVVKQNTATVVNSKGEYSVQLGSGTVNVQNVWSDTYTAQAVLDTANYSSIKAFYFETIMHTSAGEVRARLVDDSTPFVYAGEVVKTTSTAGDLQTIQIPLKMGRKQYHVQLYSTIGTGTLDSARIRVVTN